jgi:hypothetical protein
MNKYQNGKIYAICSPSINKIYIGSTCDELNRRFQKHKYQKSMAKNIIDYGDAYIELIENFSCNNKDELINKEYEIMSLYKDDIINKIVAKHNRKEYMKEYSKEYRKKNIIKLKEYARQWYLK